MTTYLLLHGAGSDGWYWHRVAPLLVGHAVVAPDLPVTDDEAGFEEYAGTAAAAVAGADEVVVVAQSLGGFVAPLLVGRVPVREIRMVAAMTPQPGESGGDWWEATGQPAAQRVADLEAGRDPDAEFDPVVTFLHDVPPDLVEQGWPHVLPQSSRPFHEPWPLDRWPDVPTRFLAATEDRLFPLAFQRRVVHQRLGLEVEEIRTGHLPALAAPQELAAWLLS